MKELMKYGMIFLLLATLAVSVSAIDTITVIQPPKTGATWPIGSTQTISWTFTGTPETVHVILMVPNGPPHLEIAYPVPVQQGSVTWTVPATLAPGTGYYVLVIRSPNEQDPPRDNSGPITITATPPCTYDLGISIDPETQSVAYGGTASWTVTVTNGGTCDLNFVKVSDVNTAVVADTGCSTNVGILPPGTKSYTCSQANVIAPFKKMVVVKGQDNRGVFYSATDSASVLLVPCNPAITLSGTPASCIIHKGGACSWSVTVENKGDVALTGVAVSGSVCKKSVGSLAVGGKSTYKCSKSGISTLGLLTYAIKAKGSACGLSVSASDSLSVLVKPPMHPTR